MTRSSTRDGAFIGHVETCSESYISGWVWDPSAPNIRETVDIYVDGALVANVVADEYRPDLLSAGIGDGAYGFVYRPQAAVTTKPVEVLVSRDELPLRISDLRHLPIAAPQPIGPNTNELVSVTSATMAAFDGGAIVANVDDVMAIAQHLFDANWYRDTYVPEIESKDKLFQYYLSKGSKEGHDPNPIFNARWYIEAAGVTLNELDPLIHYLSYGAHKGIGPNPMFWPDYYISINQVNLETNSTVLEHYLNVGYKLRYSTHPLFNPSWYSNQYVTSSMSALAHFLQVGSKQGVSPTPLFDPRWYLTTYPDVAKSELTPFEHFMQSGQAGNRNPNPLFDTKWYLDQTSPAHRPVECALIHYIIVGSKAGRDPSPRFSTAGYLRAYSDIAKAGLNPLEHYLRSGQREGRDPKGGAQGKSSTASALDIFSRFGGTEYGPIEKVLSYSCSLKANAANLSICVHIHLFHVDLADEFASYLVNINVPFTLLISVPNNETPALWKTFFEEAVANIQNCIVKRVSNVGRDVAPWVVDFSAEILRHDVFYHGHSKKSEYNLGFRDWRRYLLHNTIGSGCVVAQIMDAFSTDETLGLIYPGYFPALKAQPAWGGSRAKMMDLFKRLDLKVQLDRCPDFPSGSFFWARVSYLRPLLNAQFKTDDFDEEDAQLDSTLAHAIERGIGALDFGTGLRKLCATVDLGYNLVEFWDTKRVATNPPTPTLATVAIREEPLGRTERIAVYTCITGRFDELVAPLIVHPDIDYFLFTDSDVAPPYPFKAVSCRYQDIDPRRSARFVKTNPVLLLGDYDVVIWLDANLVLRSSLKPFLDILDESDADIGVIHHATRMSFVEEAEECIRIGADDAEVLKEQAARYAKLGVDPSNLVETNFWIARLSSPKVKTFFRLWWNEITNYSLRDQVSVNYALVKSNAKVIPILRSGRTTRDDGRFITFEHKVSNRKALVDSIIVGEGQLPTSLSDD